MKHILILGGTGFIGRHLIDLVKEDYTITVFTRSPVEAARVLPSGVQLVRNPENATALAAYLNEASCLINLAGENVGGGRWTPAFRERILNSRLENVSLIAEAFQQADNKPGCYVQGSATGYYGINPSDAEITESRPSSRDSFLTSVAVQQEEAAKVLNEHTRLVLVRTGIILDRAEGALPRIALPFRLFVGGPVGSGRQWLPWIHIHDEVRAIRFVMENEKMVGPVNLTAPQPVRQEAFARELGKALHRPSLLPAPAFALRLLLGKDRANDLLLSGLRVVPQKLTDAGFNFRYQRLQEALQDIYANKA